MISDADVADFVEDLLARRSSAAVARAVTLADAGVSLDDLLSNLVGAAQIEIGERWHRDECGVADEHAATAISDTVVAVLTAYGSPRVPDGPRVTVVCPDGEWHTLPPRMFTQLLRTAGCEAHFLSGSLPAAHLQRFLAQAQPDVVALSCATALPLDGVLDAVTVAHDAGIPVVAGGRGFGPDDHRARALGADLWAPTAAAAVEELQQLPDRLAEPTVDVGLAVQLAADRERLVQAAVDELAARLPAYRRFTHEQQLRTKEDFNYILRYAEMSILVADPRLLEDFLRWLDTLLAARGLPPRTLQISLEVLQAVSAGNEALRAQFTN